MTFVINIIGAGNLGKTIGNLFVKHQLVTIGGICNQSQISSLNAIQFIGDGNYYPTISELPAADITFITVPDDSIYSVCEELSKNPFLRKGSIIVHCSGSLTSEILLAVKNRGCHVTSIHPMRSFAIPELSVQEYKGTYCAIEGDQEAVLPITKLFNSIGSITYAVSKEKKSSYHAGAVFISNYLVTLSKQAHLCLESAGIDKEIAKQLIINIMHGTVLNLENAPSPEQALTGPIKRGDIGTLKKHMESFNCNEQKNLYSTLGKATISLTDHNEETKNELQAIFNKEEIIPDLNLFFNNNLEKFDAIM
jgi:predicted short-subunit dehydrogenase-like oxidoreductase (DUF2520 family)